MSLKNITNKVSNKIQEDAKEIAKKLEEERRRIEEEKARKRAEYREKINQYTGQVDDLNTKISTLKATKENISQLYEDASLCREGLGEDVSVLFYDEDFKGEQKRKTETTYDDIYLHEFPKVLTQILDFDNMVDNKIGELKKELRESEIKLSEYQILLKLI